ncbi:MAG: S46 family peptidase [Sinobacteraceae bacterium]|nr:S46 family peptidase [Nevskiaceae bacterium]
MPRPWLPPLAAFTALIVVAAASAPLHADEGMWTYDNFPSKKLGEQYGANIDAAWLDRLRLASVRLSNCSASFVSKDGLILTNHHCIESCLAEHSSTERSLIEDGFLARSREQELRCGAQVADVLVEMQDVTAEVLAATQGLDDQAANEARKRRLTALESACEKSPAKGRRGSALKCQSVTLYNGGQYFLYKYRRHTDVRLVFAPEAGVAAFGGDPDNFQFPRWCLDMGLLRAYEDGKPARIAAPLHIDFAGPAEGELVFVSGHPGATDRLLTAAQLGLLRDAVMPPTLLRASELRGRYIEFAQRGPTERRITQEPLNGLENGLKVRRKLLDALLDDELMARKRREEAELRQRVSTLPAFAGIGDPWSDIAAATATARALEQSSTFLEGGAGFNSRLFRYARVLVRAAAERQQPDSERLREFTETSLPRLEQQLAAAVPVYPELERLTLAFGLERMREWLGPDHPVVRRLLATESPQALATRLANESKLGDPAIRLALWNGGQAAIDASDDPMIRLARDVDPEARTVRKRVEDEVEAPTRVATEKIARARFAVYGTEVYPDATFTLRLNYGTVRGWTENGTAIAPFTRLERAFQRATGQDPFRIPASWLAVQDRLDLQTPFNLVTDNDIIGGNSGSPLVNVRGDIVGLIFDGNIHSIAGNYGFDPRQNRSVAVHPAIMREALDKVYAAPELLRELLAR